MRRKEERIRIPVSLIETINRSCSVFSINKLALFLGRLALFSNRAVHVGCVSGKSIKRKGAIGACKLLGSA
jgi:hypothetical protein